VRIDDSLPPVLGDARYNAHVLENLLSNAVKFSPPTAPVRVEAAQLGHVAATTVRDFGVGIPAGDIPKLFRRFARVGTTRDDDATPGSGLGLHFAKRIVEAQGGRISVASRPGLGSSFTYTLPLA
jgi:signal transduction histidine kinase